MKLFLLFITFSSFLSISNAQIGIGTTTPEKELDINGDLNVRDAIYLGESLNQESRAGESGALFYNSTENSSNEWRKIEVVDFVGSMKIFSVNTTIDTEGILLPPSSSQLPVGYDEGTELKKPWQVISGNTDSFSTSNSVNKINFSFQTTIQKTTSGIASYNCGIFIDNKLKVMRSDFINGNDGTNKTFNMNATLVNLPIKKDYNVKVACIRRVTLDNLGIGYVVNSTYLNEDMAQSTLTTTVLQPY